MAQRKRILAFKRNEFLKLPSGTWTQVNGTPYTPTDASTKVWCPLTIPGLYFPQILRFDWREEFEWEPGVTGEATFVTKERTVTFPAPDKPKESGHE